MTCCIYQIVGYKNTGKTTLIQKLIQHFSKHNINVGTLKHHGHGGPLKAVNDTDSYRHSQSGSIITAVQSDTELQLTINSQMEIDQIIQMYSLFNVDLLLIEGYKYAEYPKIVLLKSEEEAYLLKEITNIKAIGVRDKKLIGQFDCFTFSLNDLDSNLTNIIEHIYHKEF